MSKKHKKKHNRKKSKSSKVIPPVPGEQDSGELHALVPAIAPPDVIEDEMTRKFQENIRKSPLWDEMVRQYGPQKAEELLKQCRAKVKKRWWQIF